MTALRRLLRRRASITALLITVALALKLLVPAGFMPVAAPDGTITVQICNGMGARTMTIAIPGLAGDGGDQPASTNADMPCAFAGLAMPMIGGADPLLLAIAIAFVLAIATALTPNRLLRTPARLRPPLRAPPLPA